MEKHFLPILLLIGPLAFANCDDYRLDQNGGVMENLPVLDQRDVGTCYAQTAAQLLTAKLRTSNPRKYSNVVISPLSFALGERELSDQWQRSSLGNFTVKERASIVDGENTYFTLMNIGQFSVCDYKDVEGKLFRSNHYIGGAFDYLHSALETVFGSNANANTIDLVAAEICMYANPMSRNLQDIKDLLVAAVKQNSPVTFVREMIESKCNKIDLPKEPMPILGKHPAMAGDEFETMSYVDGLLDARHKLPIAIDYCSTVLTKGSTANGREIWQSLDPDNPEKDESCGRHASVLIGRRSLIKNGRRTCEYLIRNSWGPDCNGYAPEYKDKCENGQIWVTREALSKNIILACSLE